jgi:glutamate/tyrosine decarboxylase-like PLP-dependent enzyme
VALERDLHLHVDGAFGGYILPFLERSGYDTGIPQWDFRVPAVRTISADLHKNGMATPPASTLFFRDAGVLAHAKAVCPPNGTMTGTRGTGPIAGAWTMVKLLGDEGYQAVSLKSMALRDELIAGVSGIDGLSVYPGSRINIALIHSIELDLRPVATELRERGWMFSARAVPEPVSIVVVPMPHNHGQVEPFLEDLRDAMKFAVPFDGASAGADDGPVSQYGF